MKFHTRFCPRPIKASPSGDAVINAYEVRVNSDGIENLHVSDRKKFLYTLIQESGDLATPRAVFERCQVGTDLTKLADPSTAEFIDTVGMPRNLIEFSQFERDAKNHFNELPEAVRREYGGNYMAFGNDLISGAFNQKFDIIDGHIARHGSLIGNPKPRTAAVQPAAQPAAQAAAQPQSVTINGITYTQEVMKI